MIRSWAEYARTADALYHQLLPRRPTHAGGRYGPVVARRWHGTLTGCLDFLHGGGSVAYEVCPDGRLRVDTDGHGVETAVPGDWLAWTAGGELRVIPCAVFDDLYRRI